MSKFTPQESTNIETWVNWIGKSIMAVCMNYEDCSVPETRQAVEQDLAWRIKRAFGESLRLQVINGYKDLYIKFKPVEDEDVIDVSFGFTPGVEMSKRKLPNQPVQFTFCLSPHEPGEKCKYGRGK